MYYCYFLFILIANMMCRFIFLRSFVPERLGTITSDKFLLRFITGYELPTRLRFSFKV